MGRCTEAGRSASLPRDVGTEPVGQSLKQYLLKHGWDGTMLSRDGCLARLNIIGGQPCFEPFKRGRRLFSSRKLPLKNVFQPGLRVKFLRSLSYETYDVPGMFGWLTRVLAKGMSTDLRHSPVFPGYLDDDNNPAPDLFPFDAFLTLQGISKYRGHFTEDVGTRWSISLIPLTSVTQIEIEEENT